MARTLSLFDTLKHHFAISSAILFAASTYWQQSAIDPIKAIVWGDKWSVVSKHRYIGSTMDWRFALDDGIGESLWILGISLGYLALVRAHGKWRYILALILITTYLLAGIKNLQILTEWHGSHTWPVWAYYLLLPIPVLMGITHHIIIQFKKSPSSTLASHSSS